MQRSPTRSLRTCSQRFGRIVFCGQFWYYRETHWEADPEETLWQAASRYDGALFKTDQSQSFPAISLNKTRIDSILACMRPAPDLPELLRRSGGRDQLRFRIHPL